MTEPPFYALYCQRESKAAQALTEAGFTVFAPTYLRYPHRGRRIERETAPLLPGYVFARIDASAFHAALICDHVAYVLSANHVPKALPEAVISDLMALVSSGRMDELEPPAHLKRPKNKSRARGVRLRGLSALREWFESLDAPPIAQAA